MDKILRNIEQGIRAGVEKARQNSEPEDSFDDTIKSLDLVQSELHLMENRVARGLSRLNFWEKEGIATIPRPVMAKLFRARMELMAAEIEYEELVARAKK